MDLSRRVNTDPRRALPSVHRLAESLVRENPELPRWAASEAAQRVITAAREQFDSPGAGGESQMDLPEGEEVWLERARALARELANAHPRRVINATGIVLHTNLGRAPLAAGAAEAAARAAAGYTDLELDVSYGRRGARLAALSLRDRLSKNR